MKHRSILINLLAVMLLLLLAVGGSQAQDPEGDIGAQAAVGTAFTYQGRLNDTGGPVNGTCDFRFGLYSAASGGTPLGTDTANDVEVRDGYFSVVLNDRGEFGASAFNGEARWLGISVNCGSRNYTDLSPRQLLTSTPYALFSLNSNLLDGYDSADFLRASGGTLNGNLNVTGRIGVGTTNPQERLDVAGNVRISTGVGVHDWAIGAYGDSGAGTGWFFIKDLNDLTQPNRLVIDQTTGDVGIGRNLGIGTESPDRNLTVYHSGSAFQNVKDGTREILMGVDPNGGIISVMTNHDLIFRAGQNDEKMRVRANGNVGINTTNPQAKLHVAGQSQFDGVSEFNLGTGSVSVSTPGGWPGIIASTGSAPNDKRKEIVFKDDKLQLLVSTSSAPSPIDNGITIRESGNVGIGTTNPSATLDVSGTTRTKVLEITGGSDLAEPFEIVGAENIKPGLVVAIDPVHPGQLRLADKAYDHMVAGCVSGANGIKPGLVMQQVGSAAAGTFPVALSGRVYCWADAAYGPIQPGDLLTTSDTPGHVMKVANHEQAHGAILGKAMSSLEKGRGLILVLVTLQ